MTVDIESGGALATATLAAGVVESGKHAGGSHNDGRCANCGTALVGAYCHNCGQAGHVHRSLLHIVEETLHGVLHFDTRSWHTLPLLIARPGLLTRRYIDGQRTRYVSPLALFLFTVFLMFFVLSQISHGTSIAASSPAERMKMRAGITQRIDAARAAVADQQARLSQARTSDMRETLSDAVADARERQKDAESDLAEYDAEIAAVDPDRARGSNDAGGVGSGGLSDLDIDTGYKRIDGAIKHATENPDLLFYKLKNTAYKFSFLLIPISLPFLWMMFAWRRDVYLYDHAVFTLYSLSFMSLFFVVLSLMSLSPITSRFSSYMFVLPPMHMYMHLRETYRLGNLSTLWRTFLLLCFAATVSIVFILLIFGLSVN